MASRKQSTVQRLMSERGLSRADAEFLQSYPKPELIVAYAIWRANHSWSIARPLTIREAVSGGRLYRVNHDSDYEFAWGSTAHEAWQQTRLPGRPKFYECTFEEVE